LSELWRIAPAPGAAEAHFVEAAVVERHVRHALPTAEAGSSEDRAVGIFYRVWYGGGSLDALIFRIILRCNTKFVITSRFLRVNIYINYVEYIIYRYT